MVDVLDRYVGCLLGLAIGDALGSRTEGYSPEAIGRVGLGQTEFLDELWQWSRGRWTDDTKMAIALAESIVEERKFNPARAAGKYLAWYESGDLRGIGRTTQQSLVNLKEGSSWQESGIRADWAAGNGTAMRVAPIGLLDARDTDKLRADARDDAIITHNNHEAINGSLAVAFAVAQLVQGLSNVDELIPRTIDFIEPSDVLVRLETAQGLLEQQASPKDAVADLGTSGYVVETVASALYCFLSAPQSYETAVYRAIRGGNDTDTIAAITGAFCGAHVGVQGMPLKWREEVEDAAHIERLATQLHELASERLHG